MAKRSIKIVLCFAGGLFLVSHSVYAGVVDAINENAAPYSSDWAVTELGWFYTPALDYQLGGIETKFRTSEQQAVTVEFYEDFASGVGGTLLRSGSFVPVANNFSGIFFTDLGLKAGKPYFVAFQNTAGIGVNYTADAGATNLGLVYFSIHPGDDFDDSESGISAQPIIRFLGQTSSVAEPTTVLLLGLGVAALILAAGWKILENRYRDCALTTR